VSTLVNAVLWDADGSRPLNIEPWAMYEVPRVGERYWHHRTGFVVREFVDNLAPPELHLVREPGWEEEVRAGLPAEYILEGSRRDDDGLWQFNVLSPLTGLPIGSGGSDNDFQAAAGAALALGFRHHAGRTGNDAAD
jgi:hypothetical protein